MEKHNTIDNNGNIKISIDFDSTLSRKDVQGFVKELVKDGYQIWIVTSRFDTETALKNGWYWVKTNNNELYDVAEECGISTHQIKFTCAEDKIKYLEGKGFVLHLDDDAEELMGILESDDDCKPVNVEHFEWKETIKDILNNYGN